MNTLSNIIINTLKQIADKIFREVDANFLNDLNFKITVPNAKVDAHYSTNILFLMRPYLNKGYESIIKEALEKNSEIKTVSFLNGYINFTMQPSFFAALNDDVLKGDIYPETGLQNGEKTKVNIEYCSINPTGFLHIGHARNAIFGDSIARMFAKANYDVTKEYYVNDAGNQVDLLAVSIQARYKEHNNEPFELPENGYMGEEIKEIALLVKKEDTLEKIKTIALDYFIKNIKQDLADLKINHDKWTYESEIIKQNYIEKALELLEKKNYIYSGMRDDKKAPKGQEERKALLLLKTTEFGDDEDRPLKKADGTWTYLAPDIGYHLNKIERGFKHLICVLGADHDSYARRIKIAVKLLDENIAHETPIVQMVSFEHDGKFVKFSKRAGTSIRTKDFIKEIDSDILRFMILAKTPGTPFVFDYENACTFSMKNPVFYIQYAYARAHSIFRNTNIKEVQHNDAYCFEIKEFQEMIILCSLFKNTIDESVKQLAPHSVANFAEKLAQSFHKLWQVGKTDRTKRIIIEENKKETEARLAIIKAFITIQAECLEILGLNAPTSMN